MIVQWRKPKAAQADFRADRLEGVVGKYATRQSPRIHVKNITDPQLFGGSAVAKEFIFGLQDYSKATWSQSTSLSPSLSRLHRSANRTHTTTMTPNTPRLARQSIPKDARTQLTDQTLSRPLPVPWRPSRSLRPSTWSRPGSKMPTSAPTLAVRQSSRR